MLDFQGGQYKKMENYQKFQEGYVKIFLESRRVNSKEINQFLEIPNEYSIMYKLMSLRIVQK